MLTCNCTAGFYAKYDSIGNILWGYADGNNASVNDIDVNDANGKIIIGATPDLFTAQTLRLCDALVIHLTIPILEILL